MGSELRGPPKGVPRTYNYIGLYAYYPMQAPTNSKGVLGTYSTPGPYEQQGGDGDLFYPQVPMNNKGVLGTYSTLGPHKQQGAAWDLFYPGSPQTARGCWGPILPWVPTNSSGVEPIILEVWGGGGMPGHALLPIIGYRRDLGPYIGLQVLGRDYMKIGGNTVWYPPQDFLHIGLYITELI